MKGHAAGHKHRMFQIWQETTVIPSKAQFEIEFEKGILNEIGTFGRRVDKEQTRIIMFQQVYRIHAEMRVEYELFDQITQVYL